MRFPEAQASISALVKAIIGGVRNAPADFRTAAITADELEARLGRFEAANQAVVEAEALCRTRHAAKDAEMQKLVEGAKLVLAYAEIMYRKTPEKLTGLGWGPRRPRRAPAPPGEVRDFEILAEGDTWVKLSWKAPVKKGKIAAYEIQRRRDNGAWEDAGTSMETTCVLTGQPRGVQLEFRVRALNKAGLGNASGVVTLVL